MIKWFREGKWIGPTMLIGFLVVLTGLIIGGYWLCGVLGITPVTVVGK